MEHRALIREGGENAIRPAQCSVTPEPTALIIELFGPAAVGKTTLARALGVKLAAQGIPVRVISSARPAEQIYPRTEKRTRLAFPLTAPLARASKLFGALAAAMPRAPVDARIGQLMEILPPGSWIRSLRLRRYLVDLCRSWSAALDSDDVVIVEPGFVNVLSSLALFARSIDRRALARGLALIPEPDLLVRLVAPCEVLRKRLQERLHRQSALERLFENDVERCLRQVELAATLDSLLTESGRNLLRLSCLDDAGLTTAIDAITREIETRRGMDAARHKDHHRARDENACPPPAPNNSVLTGYSSAPQTTGWPRTRYLTTTAGSNPWCAGWPRSFAKPSHPH